MATLRTLRTLAAGALLLAERHTTAEIQKAAKQHIAQAVLELKHRRTAERAALLMLLVSIGRGMAGSITSAIVDGRTVARTGAMRRLRAELSAAGAGAIAFGPSLAHTQIDRASAEIVADSLATQWRGLALRRIYKDGVEADLAKTVRELEPRIKRAAVTEVAQAYNDEHREAIRSAVDAGWLDTDLYAREWSAEIEACESCWPLDGVQVGLTEEFPGGEEPGSVHPRCMCTEVLVASELSQRKAA